MARLYANENFPVPTVAALRRLGHDVLTVQETGKAGQAMPDEAVLAFARETGRVLLTLNRRHFIRLHNQGFEHTGIIACTIDADFVRLAQRVHDSIASFENLTGCLIRVNRPDA